jgi:signal transduction histidine kinase
MTASLGSSWRYLAIIAAGPAALLVAFALDGNVASSLISVFAGALGVTVCNLMARVYYDLEATRRREAHLKLSLTKLRVTEERSRIARDLHDGVGSELAALVWRLRRLATDPGTGSAKLEDELVAMERRVRNVLGDLRQVVLDLRPAPASWAETIKALRERCQELCDGRDLVFDAEGLPDECQANLAAHLQRIVVELVHNAAAHADPKHVEVRLRDADWTGSHGGLANIQERVAELGGRVDYSASPSGTRFEIALPIAGLSAGPPMAP